MISFHFISFSLHSPFNNTFNNPFKLNRTPKSTDICMGWKEQDHWRKDCTEIQQKKKPEWFKGKISYNSFNSNIELIDGFQNFPNKDFEFINQEKYISVKEKLKQNQKLWKNTIKENNKHSFYYYTKKETGCHFGDPRYN